MNTGSNKSRYEMTVELIKAVVWPIIAVVVLISFWRPLQDTVKQLPDLVSQSDTITIAGLSLSIDRNLQLQGQEPSAAVKEALAKLSPEDISRLLGLTTSACYPASGAAFAKSMYSRLIDFGLFQESSMDNFTGARDCVYGVEVTQLGKDTQDYLYALIAAFIQELNNPGPISTAIPS